MRLAIRELKTALIALVLGYMAVYSGCVLALNGNPNPFTPTEYPLVQHGIVSAMATDFWGQDIIVWQVTTTDDSTVVHDQQSWTEYDECSPNNPYRGSFNSVFSINLTEAQTDDKMQKVMSLLQVAQLTGMQVTIKSIHSPTGNLSTECSYGNIQDVYITNTTY